MNDTAHILRFAGYGLDPSRRSLERGGRPLALRPQAMEVLCYLARNPGRPVSKEELFHEVWPGISVTDDSLVQCIGDIRDVLEDRDHRIVKTIPRLGYLFAATISRDQAKYPALAPNVLAAHVAPPFHDHPSIAILPFVDADGDPDGLADGICEDIITALSRVRWLVVTGRSASFAFKRRKVDARQVARELSVRYVLEGSIRRAGRRLRMTVQLIDGLSGRQHWAERYDRSLSDIFDLQDEIASRLAAALESHVLLAESARALARAETELSPWDVVARAKALICRLTKHDAERAIALLQQSVAVAPDYAPAQSLLGFCLVNASHMGWIDRARGLLPGRDHAIRAIALDHRDTWGHIALGYWAIMERRTEEAIAAFRQAVELNPYSAAAQSHLSRGFAFAGRFHEAVEHGEAAIRLSPLDPEMALFYGGMAVAHHTAGRFADAVRWSLEAQRLRPGFQGSRRMLCANLALAGQSAQARSLLTRIRRDQPQLSMQWMTRNVPQQTDDLIGRYLDGMWKAGLR